MNPLAPPRLHFDMAWPARHGSPYLPNSDTCFRLHSDHTMSLSYGLNVRKKGAAPPPKRPVLDDDDGEDGEAEEDIPTMSGYGKSKPTSKPAPGLSKPPSKRKDAESDEPRTDLSSMGAAEAQLKAAQEVDASIFDYDSFHDAKETVNVARKEAARQEAIERKPKYITNLLDAAARRKQDQLIAREKLLQKEREAEGDEFADKDKFVTGAYKEQQAEARRLEEEEKEKAEEDEKRKRLLGGGMQGFYRSMIDQTERQHQEAMEAALKAEREGRARSKPDEEAQSEADRIAELRAKGVHLNDEGQIVDKRELLSAGLNVGVGGGRGQSKGGADHLRTNNKPAQSAFPARKTSNQQASRERQTRMMEEQLAERQKRTREEEEAERVKMENAAKSQKTETDKMDAKARYLARKAAKERGEG